MGIVNELGMEAYLPSGFGLGDGMLTMLLMAASIGGALVAVGVWYLRWKEYKYLVFIDEPHGTAMVRSRTEGRLIRLKDGTKRLYVRSLRKHIRIPEPRLISPSSDKRLFAGVIELLKIDEETFTPVDVSGKVNDAIQQQDIELVPLANKLNNLRDLDRDLREVYTSGNWMKDNLGMLVQLGGLMIIVIAMVLVVVFMEDNFNALSGAATSIGNAVDAINIAVDQLNSCNVAMGN